MQPAPWILAALCCLMVDGNHRTPAETQRPEDQRATVRAFVEAFNARRIDDMLRLATEDVEWLTIQGTTVSVETSGREALRKSMSAYFTSCPTCRSQIEFGASTPSRVTAVETATWTNASAERSQRSLSIYEFSGPLIRRVYYFPAER